MVRINENELAVTITKREGGVKNLTIADVKEVQRLLLDEFAALFAAGRVADVVALIESHKGGEVAEEPAAAE